MNIDQLLFNAEEEVIRKEIANLVETKALKIWANRLNLQTHREVIARTTELREDIQNTNGEEVINNSTYRCSECSKTFKTKFGLNRHGKSIHQRITYSCSKCLKNFAYQSNKIRHEKDCQRAPATQKAEKLPEKKEERNKGIKCRHCGIILKGKKEINAHAKHHHKTPEKSSEVRSPSPSSPGPSLYRCKLCQNLFPTRRELYVHRNIEHGQTGHGKSVIPPNITDQKLQNVFKANSKFIFEDNAEDDVQSTINIPLQNDVSIQEIVNQAEQIFNKQQTAFKIQFSFGFILRHIETGEFRYFIPARNLTLLERPFLIKNMTSIRRLKKKLEDISLQDFLHGQRDNTKWRLFYLTNLRISVFKTSYLLGAAETRLPDYILANQNIRALTKNTKGDYYRDNLCAFRCLSMYSNGGKEMEKTTKTNFRTFMQHIGNASIQIEDYPGLEMEDMHRLEECFEINVNIFKLREDGSVEVRRRSPCHFKACMNLNLYKNHLSYISNINAYSRSYQCTSCEQLFPSAWRCMQHERRCESKTKLKFPGGFHDQRRNIFEQLDEYDIHVDNDIRHYPYFIVFDFEAILQAIDETQPGKLKWSAEHQPISVSVCSNVEDFREPKCFVNANCDALVESMLEYMAEIAERANALSCERWEGVFIELDCKIDEWQTEEDGVLMSSGLQKMKKKFEMYCEQIPVLGFNSSRYDLNLIKKHIAKHMYMHQTGGITIKKNNSYTCIANDQFKFLDISNYLAAGTSYSGFLKAYDVTESKGFFPYEYLTNADKLLETKLPPHSAFYSSLKGKNITEEEYLYCLDVWRREKMKTMEDFLIWYNNLDVGPFVEAAQRLQKFYFDRGIDVFKVAMTVPGIAREMLFQASKESGASFALFGEEDKDLFQTVKKNIIGGPSIIFNRFSKVGLTNIRHNVNKPCGRIVGYDANALYLWALNQAMPTGTYVRRLKENAFRPEARDHFVSAYHWMDWLSQTTKHRIKHKLNYGREKRVGPYPVDGFCSSTSTIFQFHGCYHHGHDCEITKRVRNEKWRQTRADKYKNTLQTNQYIQERGYRLNQIWECQYRNLKTSSKSLQNLINKKSPPFFRHYKRKVSESEILEAVYDGRLFGMIEVDICVPDEWPSHFQSQLQPYDYFEEMAPLFCTSDIPFEAIGPHMQQHVRENGLSEKPRRLLVGGMKARKLLLASPLLQWYLQHGLEVKNIYQVIEYTPMKCFQSFVTNVTEARRQGDDDPKLSVIADTNKTIGNSAYGGLLMDKLKHRNVQYIQGVDEAQKAVNKPDFVNLTLLEDSVYEVEKAKSKIVLDLPIQLGYFILQYAKLRMLEFYYDFMDRYCQRTDFMYCEMDTDSAYMAISGKSLDCIVKPHMQQQYLRGLYDFCNQLDIEADAQHHWFPRKCCSKHAKRDKRTPGLFKLEFEGDEFVGLCSKTYIVNKTEQFRMQGYLRARRLVRKAKGLKPIKRLQAGSSRLTRETKFSCKGISKRAVLTPLNTFRTVLKTTKYVSAVNKGFRAKDNGIFSYEQERAGFTYFYCKRRVEDNGVDTKVLDITLSPE